MRNLDNVASALFEKLKANFETVSMADEQSESTTEIEKARFFNFDFIIGPVNYGNITCSLADEKGLKVFYSQNITKKLQDQDKKIWYGFLKNLREFAMRNMLTFDARDISKDNLSLRDIRTYSNTYANKFSVGDVKESKILENSMTGLYGSTKSSYQKMGPVRIIVRHSQPVDETKRGSRSRQIGAIYLETKDGERFKLRENSLLGARVFARHIANGGTLNDSFAQHVQNMIKEMKDLQFFVRSSKRRQFESADAKEMVTAAVEYYGALRETLHSLKGQTGYKTYFENYKPEDQQTEFDPALKDKFTVKMFDTRFEAALPHVAKAYQLKIREQNKMYNEVQSYIDGKKSFGVTNEDKKLYSLLSFEDKTLLAKKVLEHVYNVLKDKDAAVAKFAIESAGNFVSNSDFLHRDLAAQLAKAFIKEMSSTELRIENATIAEHIQYNFPTVKVISDGRGTTITGGTIDGIPVTDYFDEMSVIAESAGVKNFEPPYSNGIHNKLAKFLNESGYYGEMSSPTSIAVFENEPGETEYTDHDSWAADVESMGYRIETGTVDPESGLYTDGPEVLYAIDQQGDMIGIYYPSEGHGSLFNSSDEFYDAHNSDGADPGDMDGDHASGLASAGWGTDEDYGSDGESDYTESLDENPRTDLLDLDTRTLADMADQANPQAYSELLQLDLSDNKFRDSLIHIIDAAEHGGVRRFDTFDEDAAELSGQIEEDDAGLQDLMRLAGLSEGVFDGLGRKLEFPRVVAKRVVNLFNQPNLPHSVKNSPEPYRAAMWHLGYEKADGSRWWNQVMDEIEKLNGGA